MLTKEQFQNLTAGDHVRFSFSGLGGREIDGVVLANNGEQIRIQWDDDMIGVYAAEAGHCDQISLIAA